MSAILDIVRDAAGLIDFVASWLDIPLAEKQEILETFGFESRVKIASAKTPVKLSRKR
ncbi:MAG: hypothetical protein ACXWZE_05900 [Candidatus Binatia bacterium]